MVLELRASRVIVARLRPGDEVPGSLSALMVERSIRGALVIMIGGLRSLEVGVFRQGGYDVRSYTAPEGQAIELTSAIGSLALDERGNPSPHIHVTASLPDHTPVSGHLIRGVVWPLAEAFIIDLGEKLERAYDESIGLPALAA